MKARRVKQLDPSRSFAENAARIVLVRIDELRSFAAAAIQPDHARAQHDMRIAAKRLRYILEVSEPCFDERAEAARHRARDLQDVLGELRDCDVMLPRIERHVAMLRESDAEAIRAIAPTGRDLDPALAARAPNRAAYRGLEVLAAYTGARRRLLHDRFLALWAAQERDRVWEALERAATEIIEAKPPSRLQLVHKSAAS